MDVPETPLHRVDGEIGVSRVAQAGRDAADDAEFVIEFGEHHHPGVAGHRLAGEINLDTLVKFGGNCGKILFTQWE